MCFPINSMAATGLKLDTNRAGVQKRQKGDCLSAEQVIFR